MKSFKLVTVVSVALAVLLGAGGCTQTDLVAPSDGTLTLQASPTTVVINTDQGEESDTANIFGQVLDMGGIPQSGVAVLMTTTDGALLRSENVCDDGACTLSGGSCAVDTNCPSVALTPLTTDSAGFVTDELRLSLEDQNTVTVTATSGGLSQTVEVTKVVSDGNQPPLVAIEVNPVSNGVSGQTVDFFAIVDDPEGDEPTCYRWIIRTAPGALENDICLQRQTQDQVNEVWVSEQLLDVTLRVSDLPFPDCDVACDPADTTGTGFNAVAQFFDYPICAAHSAPEAQIEVVAPATTSQQLSAGGGDVTWELSGNNSFDDGGIADYDWDCGSGGSLVGSGSTAFCTYSSAGTKVVTLTVTEGLDAGEIVECSLEDDVTIFLTVTAAPAP